ncbi:hypothetical protein BH10BAC3_BH10BAC3_19570 [soil metagenome]
MKKVLLSVFFCISIFQLTFSQVQNYVPLNGLVGWWPFSGDAVDSSGNGNNGTVNGAILTTDRFGSQNSAYSFNGINNYISIPNSASLQNLTSITISAWINIQSWYSGGGQLWFPILNKSDQQGQYGKYSVALSSTGAISHLDTKENGYGYSNFTLKKWYHIVVTFSNSDTTKFFVNGVNIYSGPTFSFPQNSVQNLPLIIGKDAPGLIEYSNGFIDDIGIWNRALTDSEIRTFFTESVTLNSNKTNVGINVSTPVRSLHVKDVLRLEPRLGAPLNPSKGDIYFDGYLNKLLVYDGTKWQSCW